MFSVDLKADTSLSELGWYEILINWVDALGNLAYGEKAIYVALLDGCPENLISFP